VSLSPGDLAQGLQDLFEGKPLAGGEPDHPADVAEAGARWAEAYAGYAAAAVAGATAPGPGLIAAAQQSLATALAAAIRSGNTDNAPPLAAMETGFDAFWAGMAFLGPGVTGAVTLVPVPPALADAIKNVFDAGLASPPPTTADQASSLAGALHDWTTQVTVTNVVTATGATTLDPLS
jgi:hypothetical protein